MIPLALGLLTSALSAVAPPGESPDPVKPPDPVVLAKGKGFVVHGIGAPSGIIFLLGHPQTPATVLYTALPSGKLSILARSGTAYGIPIPMGITRVPVTHTRVAGVAADAERLYVLMWTAKWSKIDAGGGSVLGERPPKSGTYTLKVFWLADGSEIAEVKLTGARRPKDVHGETLKEGPLAVEDGGVTVFGEAVRFEGKERVK